MARGEIERTVQQSVFDRLIDANPPMSMAESVQRLKNAVRRDLEWLLNTRRTPVAVPDTLPELRRSVFLFGLPDVSALARDSRPAREKLRRYVQEAVTTFEPRLADVRVSLVDDDAPGAQRLRFVIDAMLRVDPSPEQVQFDTVLEFASGGYKVKGEGSGE
jgi:type VI secretion system protein ImpF